MPSGFQQDTNQLQPNFYRVAIDMSNATYFPLSDGDNNGSCTPLSWDAFTSDKLPTTAIKARARARGNLRFRNLVNRLTGLADCQILDVTTIESNGDSQPTALSFTVKYERDAFIPVTGTAVDGSTAITTTALAIANEITKGLYYGSTASMRVYDPVATAGAQQSITANAATTLANLFTTVTVSLIDTVTTINS